MAIPRKIIDTEAALGVENGAISSATPTGISPGVNEIVYVDGVIGDGAFGGGGFSAGDFDYYSVYIAPNSTITAAIYGAQWGSALDAKINIFDAAGNSVSGNDNFGTGNLDPLLEISRIAGGM